MHWTKVLLVFSLVIALSAGSGAQDTEKAKSATPVLWQDPGDMALRDLFYGPGSPDRAPQPPFRFLEEDLDGTTPKYDVVDRNGIKWQVKLGIEARPEVAAARLVWAPGYFAQENYFVARLKIEGLPEKLERGRELIAADGTVYGARLKRNPENAKNAGPWSWRENPFAGTRELNGLRVMMALISNLDVKDTNNKILRMMCGPDGDLLDIYMASDLGAAFSEHLWPYGYKGNLRSYRNVEFILKIKADTVDLGLPAGPKIVDIGHLPWYFKRRGLRWIGKDIPRGDARWIGQLLGGLSREQVESAFRAAGFTEAEIEGFADEFLGRVAALQAL